VRVCFYRRAAYCLMTAWITMGRRRTTNQHHHHHRTSTPRHTPVPHTHTRALMNIVRTHRYARKPNRCSHLLHSLHTRVQTRLTHTHSHTRTHTHTHRRIIADTNVRTHRTHAHNTSSSSSSQTLRHHQYSARV
jgi:hypothetical protein